MERSCANGGLRIYSDFLLTSRKVGRRRFSFFAFVRPRHPRSAPSYPPFRSHRFFLEGGSKVWQVIRVHVHIGGACNHSEPFLRHTVAERTKPDFCMGGGAGNDKSIRSLARLPSLQFIALAPPSEGSRLSRFTRGLEEGSVSRCQKSCALHLKLGKREATFEASGTDL